MKYREVKTYILEKLERELPPQLRYHGYHHTLDVLQVTANLCREEGVSDEKTTLVKTAALFHDAGFINNKHADHEAVGCEIARAVLPEFAYSKPQIEEICAMIMATKIPQSPKNRLEEILCDADLDYLGRADFYPIASSLFDELKAYQIIGDEQAWNRIQVGFLSNHQYWTPTNRNRREPEKQQRLNELKLVISGY
jgi:uncharacterized protein